MRQVFLAKTCPPRPVWWPEMVWGKLWQAKLVHQGPRLSTKCGSTLPNVVLKSDWTYLAAPSDKGLRFGCLKWSVVKQF